LFEVIKVIHVYLSVFNDMAYSIIVSVTWFCSNIWLCTILYSLTISYTVVSSTEAKLTSECISVTTRYFVSVFLFYSAPCHIGSQLNKPEFELLV